MNNKIRTTESIPVIDGTTLAGSQHTLKADVVIIGSGAGGAVNAYELAAKGLKVIVLEAGDFFPSSQFPRDIINSMTTLYQDKGFQLNSSGDISILQGVGIGGSTLVNGAVTFRTPDHYLREWGERFGLDNFSPEKLTPHFEKVEKRLSIHENAPYETNAAGDFLLKACKELGYSAKMLSRNTKQCMLTGKCLSGCRSDRKQSMLVTYIPWAIDKGATFYCNTPVAEILSKNGVATGVKAHAVNPKTGQRQSDITVLADKVILSAGAIQSPLIALNSEGLKENKHVGKHFACHPSAIVVAEYEQKLDGWRGATLSSYVDEFEHPDKGGYIIEAGTSLPALLSTAVETGVGTEYMDFIAKAENYAILASLIHDHNVGQVYWDNGRKRIDYDLIDKDYDTLINSIRTMSEVLFTAGAKQVYLPTSKLNKHSSMAAVNTALENCENTPNQFYLTSYHPQGTMRMSSNSANSVVNQTGESHDIKNLFVSDASLFPTSILVNPQLTVYAMASLISGFVAS